MGSRAAVVALATGVTAGLEAGRGAALCLGLRAFVARGPALGFVAFDFGTFFLMVLFLMAAAGKAPPDGLELTVMATVCFATIRLRRCARLKVALAPDGSW